MCTFENVLNDEQYDAVTSTEGPVCVLAGPGSGKTRALVYRYAYIVTELGIDAQRILCTTFSNKAASEIKKRIRHLIGDQDTGYVCTIHGLCAKILRQEICQLYWPLDFLILSREDSGRMLQNIAVDQGGGWTKLKTDEVLRMIGQRKKEYPDEYMECLFDLSLEDLFSRYHLAEGQEDKTYFGYLYYQRKNNGLDYNDLIYATLGLFARFEDSCKKWQSQFEYIMVDEAQDLDNAQFNLLKLLSSCYQNIMLVGDPDQTLYRWRGANGYYLINFNLYFRDAKTIQMMKNYRSSPQIIRVANKLIAFNHDRIPKEIVATRAEGPSVCYHHCATISDEASWVASTITAIADNGISYKDIAIIYRGNSYTRNIEIGLQKEHIPYKIIRGQEFFKRREVVDIICYLRLIAHKDDLSFDRVVNVPPRKIGKMRREVLENYATKKSCSLFEALRHFAADKQFASTGAKSFVEMIDELSEGIKWRKVSDVVVDLIKKSGYEELIRKDIDTDRHDNLAELVASIRDFEAEYGEECTVNDYLAYVALYTIGDDASDQGSVKLMTAHASKGLEYNIVFLVGLNENIFPSSRALANKALEEERRAAFVAITRAKDMLFLSSAEGFQAGQIISAPSRFLGEIGPELLECTKKEKELISDSFENNELNPNCADKLWPIGTRVEHPLFGVGMIISADARNASYSVQFADNGPMRHIMASGPLVKI